MGDERVENLGAEAACLAHALEPFGAVELDRAIAGLRHVGGYGHIFGHRGDIGRSAGFFERQKR